MIARLNYRLNHLSEIKAQTWEVASKAAMEEEKERGRLKNMKRIQKTSAERKLVPDLLETRFRELTGLNFGKQ